MTSLTVPTYAKQIRPPLPCCSRKPVRMLREFSLPAPPCLSFPWHRRFFACSFCAGSASPCPSRLPDADAKQDKIHSHQQLTLMADSAEQPALASRMP